MTEPSESLRRSVEQTLGQPVLFWHRPELGLSAAERFSIELADSRRYFVKAAVDAFTAGLLHNEHVALEAVKAPYQPGVIAFVERDGGFPVLVTEDLSHAYWPASDAGVTWRPGDIDRLLGVVKEMAATEAPTELPALGLVTPACYWPPLIQDPAGFLKLGICDEAWLTKFGPLLVEAESTLKQIGPFLVHGDVRSDNICLLPGRVVLVDWSNSGRGNGEADLAGLLPTLHLEGGPRPFDIMPEGAAWAAWQAGSLAVRALGGQARSGSGQTEPEWLIRVLIRLARINLVWAADCLDLPHSKDSPPGMKP